MVDRPGRREALLAIGGILGCTGGGLLLWQHGHDADTNRDIALGARARTLGVAHGIVVGMGDPSSFYVPPFLPADAAISGVEVLPAQPSALTPALDGIEAALMRYPTGFVAGLIEAIFIGGRIRIQGANAGGTYGPAWILLSAPLEIGAPSIEFTCRMGVHHELSSFIYLRGDTAERWRAAEPADWPFADSAARQLGGDSASAPPLETGFLSAYGATSPENDFNVYAEKMLTEPGAVMHLAGRVPAIARKLALVRQAYLAIDPRMEQALSSTTVRPAATARRREGN